MEGPSIVILAQECAKFAGLTVTRSAGSSKIIDVRSLRGQRLIEIRTWGKHLILRFDRITVRIHFMLFGSYSLDVPKEGRIPRLSLRFSSGELFTYACSIRELTAPLDELYDWSADLMASTWDEDLAVRRLQDQRDELLCDVMLRQEIFAGAGNIFKNEVLYRLGLRPETKLRTLTEDELRLLAREMRLYAFQFFLWKREFRLRKNWKVYKRKICAVCGTKTIMATTGTLHRRSHYCPQCQHLRTRKPRGRPSSLTRARLAALARMIRSCAKERARAVSSGRGEGEH